MKSIAVFDIEDEVKRVKMFIQFIQCYVSKLHGGHICQQQRCIVGNGRIRIKKLTGILVFIIPIYSEAHLAE